MFQLLQQNLLSPPLLFFALGLLAGLLKSDLNIPEQVSKFLLLYLMVAIGFKGGATLAQTAPHAQMAWTMLAGLAASFLQPFLSYWVLRRISRLDKLTAAAVAAHYGSISMVTFAAATNFLEDRGVPFAGYMVAVVALMEAPAMVSGLLIAHHVAPQLATTPAGAHGWRAMVTNGALVLLFGAFAIGWITGPAGMQKVEAALVAPFQGLLVFFLLDMGLLVARHLADLPSFSLSLLLFGLCMPLIHALLGIGLSRLLGLEPGTGFLLAILLASSSYIVVTPAIRTTLPQAKVAIYLPMSLAITFPFNIAIGIPLYWAIAERCLS